MCVKYFCRFNDTNGLGDSKCGKQQNRKMLFEKIVAMKQMPSIGTRVRYERKKTAYLTERSCVGTVVAQYRGGYPCHNEETGERRVTPDALAGKGDTPRPAWWPRNSTDPLPPHRDES